MAKIGRLENVGNCLDCEHFLIRENIGPYKGVCTFSGEKVSHIMAYTTHDCFSLADWWNDHDSDFECYLTE
jgi:hypothetical protein